jgi:hypothetical protein
MSTTPVTQENIKTEDVVAEDPLVATGPMTSSSLDKLLEKEKQNNKGESWNKLDNTVKIQALHAFAETYGKDKSMSTKDIKTLKTFFGDCLRANKLNKTKDVKYDKDIRSVTAVPALFYNTSNHNFTLRIVDAKRVSTLKSLTPKRTSIKNPLDEEDKIENV